MLAALWETIVINLQPWKGFLVAILEISFYINEIKSITPGPVNEALSHGHA